MPLTPLGQLPRYLGSPIEGVESYEVVDQYGYLAGPLPWVVATLEATYLALLHPCADIEIQGVRP